MVVCKFYLQGNCKFGDSCWYDHPTSNAFRSNDNVYFHKINSASSRSDKDSQELHDFVSSVQEEIARGQKGGQWPLSSFAPIKQRPCIPGWQDWSPEEVRWMMYQATLLGNVDSCKLKVKELHRNAEVQKAQLLSATPETYSLLDKVYRGEVENGSPFSFVQGINTTGSTGMPSGSSVFGQSVGVSISIDSFSFTVPQPDHQTNTVFGSSPTVPQKNNPSLQQQGMFGNTSPQQSNDFGGGAIHTGSPFGSSSQSNNVFAQQNSLAAAPFSFAVPAISQQSHVVDTSGKSAIGLALASIQSSNSSPLILSEDTSVYSPKSELTEQEISQFMNPTFSLAVGNIPTKPPPKDLCVM